MEFSQALTSWRSTWLHIGTPGYIFCRAKQPWNMGKCLGNIIPFKIQQKFEFGGNLPPLCAFSSPPKLANFRGFEKLEAAVCGKCTHFCWGNFTLPWSHGSVGPMGSGMVRWGLVSKTGHEITVQGLDWQKDRAFQIWVLKIRIFGGMKVAWALEHGALHILALKTVCSDQSRVLFFSLLLRVASESNKIGQASLGMNYILCFLMFLYGSASFHPGMSPQIMIAVHRSQLRQSIYGRNRQSENCSSPQHRNFTKENMSISFIMSIDESGMTRMTFYHDGEKNESDSCHYFEAMLPLHHDSPKWRGLDAAMLAHIHTYTHIHIHNETWHLYSIWVYIYIYTLSHKSSILSPTRLQDRANFRGKKIAFERKPRSFLGGRVMIIHHSSSSLLIIIIHRIIAHHSSFIIIILPHHHHHPHHHPHRYSYHHHSS